MSDRVEALVRRLHDKDCGCSGPLCVRLYTTRLAVRAGLELAAEVADAHETCGADICDYAPKAIAIKIRALAEKE